MRDRRQADGYAVLCGMEDRRRFERVAASSTALTDLIERGRRTLRAFPRLMTDVFCFFYSPDAEVGEDVAGGADRLQTLIVGYLRDAPEYQRIRRMTALDFDAAAGAAEQFGRRLLEFLETTAQRRSQGGTTASTPPVHIDGITFADAVTPGDGSPLDRALLVLAKEIDDDAGSLRVLTDLCWSWGSERGSLQRLPYEERMALARRVRDTEKLQELARLVGRMRELAVRKQQTRIAPLPHEVYDVTLGDDWDALLTYELGALAHPMLRYDFYERLLDRRVAQYELHGEETCAQGSIVACVDTSGSMAGGRELTAKAIALALLDVARLQQRQCVIVIFSSAGEWRSFAFVGDRAIVRDPNGHEEQVSPITAMVRVGTEFFGGGTDYESPLREAIRALGEEQAQQGDIVFITDDQCEVSKAFRDEYAAVKQAKRFETYGVIVGARSCDAQTLVELSDTIISSAELTDDVASRVFESV